MVFFSAIERRRRLNSNAEIRDLLARTLAQQRDGLVNFSALLGIQIPNRRAILSTSTTTSTAKGIDTGEKRFQQLADRVMRRIEFHAN